MTTPPPSLTLRPATPADLALLRYWDTQPHVIAADPNDDWEWEKELHRTPPWREQLIAEIAGEPIGFLQIIDPRAEESHYWGDVAPGMRAIDIWIGEARHLNRGYGTEMMRLAIERCFAEAGVRTILIDPLATNVSAHRFYQRLGFAFREEKVLGGDRVFVFALSRTA